MPALLHGVLVQSTIAKGRILHLDASAAQNTPGFIYILTAENCPQLQPLPSEYTDSFPGERRTPLGDNVIHYAGQHVALVVARTLEAAQAAAAGVRVSYEEETPVLSLSDNLGASYQPDHFAKNSAEKLQSVRGTPGKTEGFAQIQSDFETPIVTHNPMEPSATVAVWHGDRLTLHDSTRWLDGTRMFVGHMLGIPEDNVRVECPFVGGAFGSKSFLWQHVVLAAVAARTVQRPLKLMLTRQQMFTSTGHRPHTFQTVTLAADANGHLQSIHHDSTNDTSPVAHFFEPAAMTARNLYRCENVEISHRVAPTNIATPCFMRAPGESPGMFALEAAMDELAYKLGVDPLELRRRNYAESDLQDKRPWSSKHLDECYEQGAKRFGWQERTMVPGSMRRGNLRVGWGMATACYPARRAETMVRAVLGSDGQAIFSSATHELGSGTATIMRQIAADALDLPLSNVDFRLGDSEFPKAPVTGASQTAASVGSAVQAAAAELRTRIVTTAVTDKASPLFGLRADDVVLEEGTLRSRAESSKSEPYRDVLRRMNPPHLEVVGEAKPGAEKEEFTFSSFGAHFAEVLVDLDLCQVRVSRWVGVFDPGRVLNPMTARSQVLGGIVFGLGMALFEETVYDQRSGAPLNANLAEYLLPTNPDSPEIDVSFIDAPDFRFAPVGCRGVGELGITGVPGAIANAIYHATGKRIRHLPITPEKLLA